VSEEGHYSDDDLDKDVEEAFLANFSGLQRNYRIGKALSEKTAKVQDSCCSCF